MNVDDYLERIEYHGGREPNAENLAALVKAHRFTVPYETLDIWRGRHTTLATETLYDKIVVRRRGGYCFELNGLFAWLLRELGYNVREYFGRWHLGEQMDVPKRRHRVVVVALKDHPNQIADVGIGMPFLVGLLPFAFDVSQTVGLQTYRIVRDPMLSAVVEVRKRDGTWTRLFSFDTAPQLPVDFAYAHYWCETHPSSDFRRLPSVFIPEPGGVSRAVVMEGDPESGEPVPTFIRTATDGKILERRPLRSETALAVALANEFGIVESA